MVEPLRARATDAPDSRMNGVVCGGGVWVVFALPGSHVTEPSKGEVGVRNFS
jgi:hypothetical protein